MAITQIEGTAQTFLYNGLVAFGDPVADYSSTDLDTIMKTMKGVGQIPDGSTEWTGEDTSMENWTDEGGGVLDVTITQGTFGFAFEVASFSKEQLQRWLKSTTISTSFDGTAVDSGATVEGIAEIPIQTLPGCIIDQTKKQAIVYPKMQVTGNVSYADKRFRLKINATALSVNTDKLKTMMTIKGAIKTEDKA